MYSANHYMDPYHSHYRNHAPYPYYPPPRWEIPSGHPRAMDSSYYRPPSCGTWPHNHDMHHSHPEFHCCCNQTYPPGYCSFRPPFPQELPPPHLYYHGPFPQHPNACPPYFVPSYPYPIDHTPYGYDKFRSHYCGCPNHVSPGADKSNVKIEEERPDVKLESEHKNAGSGSIIQNPNNPFIWLPSGNIKGKENGEHYELSPQILNEWAPMSSKSLGDMKQQEQDNQKGKQFPWPIVWMPAGYDVPNQKAKEMNDTEETQKSPRISEETPQSPKIKIIPLSWFENGHHHDQQPATRNDSGDHNNRSTVKNQPVVTDHKDSVKLEGNPKTTPAVPKSINDEKKPRRENCKTIPVVLEKEINEKKASTCRTIPVMKESDEKKIGMRENKDAKEANSAEKVEENRKTKHSDSSIAKHSKLPPVCLRVDPLPRKKSGNGSSRSPSPPTRKDADSSKENMKEAQSQNLEPKQSGVSKHITVSEVKENLPYEMKEIGFSNGTVQAASIEHSQEEETPTSKDDQIVQAGSTVDGAQENAGLKSRQGGAVQENAGAGSLNGCDKCKKEDGIVIESEAAKNDTRTYRVNLSEPDAAVCIQSAYRGYDVRRCQPLDKLRKIRHVHEQMQGVKKQLQCLEDSCNKPTQKEQVAISETIMNLLLKLDTIQGLHPSVREARKSVARELICLQEKLDTLCKAPSGDLNHRNSNDDESRRTENIIQAAPPTVITEASDRQERTVELGKVEEPSSVDYMEPCNVVTPGVSWEVRPDAGASEEKNEKQESCSIRLDEAHEEGKAEGQIEFQVTSSMDTVSDEASTEHPTDNLEHGIGEPNVNSVEQETKEEKPAADDEVKESPLVNSMAPLYDTASAGHSSELKQYTSQYTASTDQSLYAESNTRSPASTEDINTSPLTASVENEVATEKDGPIDSQVHETAALEIVELKDDVSSAENEHNKSSSPVVNLEDPLVRLKDVELHGLTPAKDFVSNKEDQEAKDIGLQVQAVDSMKDSAKVPDGTAEASTNDDLELGTTADVEKHDQLNLLEPRLESVSAPELTILDESDDKMQCGVSDKDEVPHVDEKTETTIDTVTEGSANCEDPLCEASRKEPDIQESHASLGEEADDTIGGAVFPDSDSCELSCPHDGGMTVYEGPEMNVSSENQTDAQKENIQSDVSETDECIKTQKAAPVGTEGENCVEDSDLPVSEMDKCNEMPKDAPAHATGANPAEDEASLKEDITVQTENKACASPAPEGRPMVSDEKLAEENQKLKELLQKLVASGNDQMGVITDLSEKVKALERKLARKKRPKVRVQRPSRQATAKVH